MRNASARQIPSLVLVLGLAWATAAIADPQYDLTPPDVKLVKLSFKLNDIEYSVRAPEGATIETRDTQAVITKGKDFGFTIDLSLKPMRLYKGLWANIRRDDDAKNMIINKKNSFLVELAGAGERRFAAVAKVEVPYVDLVVRSSKGGTGDDDAQPLTNCLLVLKCAGTVALVAPPPTEPPAILEWLKADYHKDDDGNIQSVALPPSATAASVQVLEKIPTLKSLTISISGTTEGGLLGELEGMRDLEELGLVCESISEIQLLLIANFPNLTTVSLGASTGTADIDELGLRHLQKLKNLQVLDLTNTRAGDAALACLKDMTSLKVIRLGSTQATDHREGPRRAKLSTLTDDGLASLANLTNLETLSLRRTDITGVGFKQLTGLKKLQNLELNDTFVTDDGLEQIGAIESLQLLQIARTNITSAGLKHLAKLEGLKELDLTDTAVDDEGLRPLSGLTTLESLQLRRTRVTDEGLLQLDTLRNLETLNLSETKVTDAGLPHLYRLKKLQSLYTSDTAVTQDALDKLDRARESQ